MDNEIKDILGNYGLKDNPNVTKDILILSGGGVKGISHFGALHYLLTSNYIKSIKLYQLGTGLAKKTIIRDSAPIG